jgi:hypothetical protein
MAHFLQRPVLAMGLAVAACTTPTAQVCTESVEPGIVVRIVDSVTGEPKASMVKGEATAPGYADSLRAYESLGTGQLLSLAGAFERAGVYAVTIRGSGYRDWQADQIRVAPGGCHVKTVTLTARLQTAP